MRPADLTVPQLMEILLWKLTDTSAGDAERYALLSTLR
jgi:hypothetical protein